MHTVLKNGRAVLATSNWHQIQILNLVAVIDTVLLWNKTQPSYPGHCPK